MALPQMNRRHLQHLCGFLLLALALTGCKPGKSHQESRDIGYKGEARTNPFLALQRVVDQLGWESSQIHSMSEAPRSGTLVLSGNTGMKPAVAIQALEWVEHRGGHLILLVQGAESRQDDWQEDFASLFFSVEKLKLNPIMTRIGLIPNGGFGSTLFTSSKTSALEIPFDRKPLKLSDKGGISLDTTAMRLTPDLIEGKRDDSHLVSLPWGGGRITVVSNAAAFRNRYLGQDDNAQVFVRLLELHNQGSYNYGAHSVTLLLAANDTFFTLLWKQYWMALLGLVALIGAWLWKNLPRFGPLQPVRNLEMRKFSEHLLMSGDFLYKHGQTVDLLLPIRNSITQKLLHHHGLNAYEAEGHIIELLANVSLLPLDRVANAWNASFVKDGRLLLTYIQDLQTIEQAL